MGEGEPSQDLPTITQLGVVEHTNLGFTKDNYSIVMICLSFVNSNYLINKEQKLATLQHLTTRDKGYIYLRGFSCFTYVRLICFWVNRWSGERISTATWPRCVRDWNFICGCVSVPAVRQTGAPEWTVEKRLVFSNWRTVMEWACTQWSTLSSSQPYSAIQLQTIGTRAVNPQLFISILVNIFKVR